MNIKCMTDIGKIRDINEDYVLVLRCKNFTLLIVTDGMGGHNAGEIASRIAATTIRDYIFENFQLYNDKEELIRDAMVKSNSEVFKESQSSNKLLGMGTTATCCIVFENKIYLGHVGDSRAYIINKEGIKKISEDHSYVQELINSGSITENEALDHPQRNLITRAIGIEKYVVVDIKTENINDGNFVILCTDGLSSYVSCEEILKYVVENSINAVELLIELAKDRGGSDNISLIIAEKVGEV